MVLSAYQRDMLKKHEYKSEGCSLIESLVLCRFWDWLTLKFPLWLAPNTITLIGFVTTLFATLCVIVNDMNCEGTAPRWTYLLCAIGIFTYQTLDGCDGKQARRTGTSSPLGELFDHGCDVYATFLYALAAACVPGLIEYPYMMFALVVLVIQLNYTYHWQTYVCGILFFKKIDIGEALLSQMFGCLLSFLFGPAVWQYPALAFLGIHYPMKFLVALGTLFFGVINLLSAYHICLTRGVGKNGSTLAGTSVVSPITTPLVVIGFACFYGYHSPSSIHLHHSVLFMTALLFPLSKGVVNIMIAGMTKTPFSLLDTIMLGPLLACLNVYFSTPLPEYYFLLAIALYNIYDVTVLLIELCLDFCDVLGVSVFTVPKEKLLEVQKLQASNK